MSIEERGTWRIYCEEKDLVSCLFAIFSHAGSEGATIILRLIPIMSVNLNQPKRFFFGICRIG